MQPSGESLQQEQFPAECSIVRDRKTTITILLRCKDPSQSIPLYIQSSNSEQLLEWKRLSPRDGSADRSDLHVIMIASGFCR